MRSYKKLAKLRAAIAANPDEDTVEGHLVRRLDELRVPCYKLKGPNGWFDRPVFWPGGRPSLVETKRPKGGRYEAMQARMHAKFVTLGYDVHVLLTKQAVDIFIDTRLHLCRTVESYPELAKAQRRRIMSGAETRRLKGK